MIWLGQYVSRLTHNRIIRYLVSGFFTTLISFGSFGLLIALTSITPHTANIISVLLALIFAYVANKKIVFQSKADGVLALFFEVLRFTASRFLSMIIEIAGVFILIEFIHLGPVLSKALISVLVVIFNYLAFQFFIFRSKPCPSDHG